MSTAVEAEAPISDYERERGKPMPSFSHGVIQMRLGAQFMNSVDLPVVSELTLELAEKPDRTPDVCLMNPREMNPYDDSVRESEPPLLVVEILSPTQSAYSVMEKAGRYFDHGVKSFWLVDPTQQCVTIRTGEGKKLHFDKADGVIADPVTGAKADLEALFAP